MSPAQTVILLMAAATLATVRARPQAVPLEKAVNNTVCPIKVEVDYDPTRVPRRIKLIKCDEKPQQWCANHNIPQNECCDHNHNDHRMECVQIEDTVLVEKLTDGKLEIKTIEVPVGCSCMVNDMQNADRVSSGL